MAYTPMQHREGTGLVYIPGGGFDVRNCPDAINLAAHIAKCVNSHDLLVTALERCRALIEKEVADGPFTDQAIIATNALALAKGQP